MRDNSSWDLRVIAKADVASQNATTAWRWVNPSLSLQPKSSLSQEHRLMIGMSDNHQSQNAIDVSKNTLAPVTARQVERNQGAQG